MPTTNQQLLDRIIRHQVFLERLRGGEARRVVGFVNQKVLPDVLSKIVAGLSSVKEGVARGRGIAELKRLQRMLDEVNGIVAAGMLDARNLTVDRLTQLGVIEAKFQIKLLDESIPLSVRLSTPSVAQIREIVMRKPFQGKILHDWFKALDSSLKTTIQEQLNIGLIQGETTSQIVRRLRGGAGTATSAFGKTRRNVESVVRTAVNHVASKTREAAYDANDDLVREVKYVATLDSRTTLTCASLDGMVFPINEGPRPPQHFGCRSTTVPVIRSWKELGLKDPPPSTRASLDGEVPDDETYSSWLKKQSAATQDEALGKQRAELFREGKVEINGFVDGNQRPLTLEQLAAKEGIEL